MLSKKHVHVNIVLVAAFCLLVLTITALQKVDGFGYSSSIRRRAYYSFLARQHRPQSQSCCRSPSFGYRRHHHHVSATTATSTGLLVFGATAQNDAAAAAASSSRALLAEQQTIQRALVEEELLTTISSSTNSASRRYPLQEPSNEELQAAIQVNTKFWKEQQRLTRGIRKRTSTVAATAGGMGFQSISSSSSSKKKTKKNTSTATITSDAADAADVDESPDQPHIAFNPKLDIDGYAAIIRTLGAVRKNQVLSQQTVAPLRQFIDDELVHSLDLIHQGKIREQARFARVLLKRNRYDMSLPFEQTTDGADIIMQALWELLGDGSSNNRHGSVGYIFESALTQNAILHEFGAMISDPGSNRQILHPDMAHQGSIQTRTGPPFLTCFVAVQDVDADMGPTEILLSTNTMEAHEMFSDYNVRDEYLQQFPSVAMALLRQGDALLYDTTTLHAGTANKSCEKKRRRIFYCTFRSITMKDDRTRDEPGSIRADLLERQLSLHDIRKILYYWKNTQTNKQINKQKYMNHDNQK